MTVHDFLHTHLLCPEQLDAEAALSRLLEAMEKGLRGEGNIPMLPSYLPGDIPRPKNTACRVLDAGGTNLRSARAVFDESGHCRIEDLIRVPMPGTAGPMDADAFYRDLAELTGTRESRIGFCFSYNVEMEPNLDGRLLAWCKEVQVPGAVGRYVGAALKEAIGPGCERVHVLNDSVAAMLGAATPERKVRVGMILGTGVNVCYEERCEQIPKLGRILPGKSMIISTEVGEFDGFPQNSFDLALFAATEDPTLAHAEKQCAGGYLGQLICRAWQGAAEVGVLTDIFRKADFTLPQISDYLAGLPSPISKQPEANRIASALIHRAAVMAAVLCAGPVIRCTAPGETASIAMEGSQFTKLHGFREVFLRELENLLSPRSIGFAIVQTDNACLKGAALAAFAEPV